ncbi:MAG: hypothetical protein KH138_10390 [Firmicutes bacterium]|nr:hypothetical protein [Bacillota bacterium]
MANVSSEQENIQTFYREQNELLFRYAMLLTGDRHQAEEALQTAWCQCHRCNSQTHGQSQQCTD